MPRWPCSEKWMWTHVIGNLRCLPFCCWAPGCIDSLRKPINDLSFSSAKSVLNPCRHFCIWGESTYSTGLYSFSALRLHEKCHFSFMEKPELIFYHPVLLFRYPTATEHLCSELRHNTSLAERIVQKQHGG